MGNPIILYDNILEAEDTYEILAASDTDSGFDVLDVIDRKQFTFWQADATGNPYIQLDLNKITNPGFEDGDSTGYEDNAAGTIDYGDTVEQRTGSNSLKVTASGDQPQVNNINIPIDPTKVYRVSIYHKMTAYTSGAFLFSYETYDINSNLVSSPAPEDSISGVEGDWTQTTFSIGPSGSGADNSFVAGEAFLRILIGCAVNSTLTMYIDDFLVYEEHGADTVAILGHNFLPTRARYSVGVGTTENYPATTDTTLEPFAIITKSSISLKQFTETSPNLWRVVINTPYAVPELAILFIGKALQFSNPQRTPLPLRNESPIMEITRAKKGQHLGTVRSFTGISINVRIPVPTKTWYDTNFIPFWDNHASLGKPFFFAWDLDNEPDLVWWAVLDPDFVLEQNHTTGQYVDEIQLTMNAMKEE